MVAGGCYYNICNMNEFSFSLKKNVLAHELLCSRNESISLVLMFYSFASCLVSLLVSVSNDDDDDDVELSEGSRLVG